MTWDRHKLEDVSEIVSGSTPKTDRKDFWDGPHCWATPKDLSQLDSPYISDTPRKITDAGLQSCSAPILPAGSVLFSSRAPIGHVAINTVPMCTNQGFKSFVPHQDKVFNKYLFYWLKANKDFLQSLGNGATFKEVSKSVIGRVEVPLPPLDEQKRIAEVLDKADALRQKRRLALQKLDSLLQSVFIDMFGDPVTNPKGWNVENLGDVSRLVSGNSLPEGEEFIEQKDGLFLLKVSDMNSKGNEELINVANLWAAGYGNANVICPKDSIIIPKRGGAIFTNKKRMLTRPAVLDPNLMAIIPDERIIDPQFLFQWFKGFDLGSLTSGSSVPQLNKQDLYPLRIAIPPFEKQEEFRKVASIIKVAEQKQKASNVHLDQLFNSLQQRAFSGHIFT